MSFLARCCGSGAHDEKDYTSITALDASNTAGLAELFVTLADNQVVNLALSSDSLTMVRKGVLASQQLKNASKSAMEVIPLLNVLSVTPSSSGQDTLIQIVYLKQSKGVSRTRTLSGTVLPSHSNSAKDWCAQLYRNAYPNPLNKRLRVLVNPFGGPGKAKSIWEQSVRPVLEAAGCEIHMSYTGPAGTPENAWEVSKNLDLDQFDAIVCVSGDGCFHEILNGLASRPDGAKALRMPIVPIAAGSGNAISVNAVGPKNITDFGKAALGIAKGKPIALDLCSVTQGGNRYYSFLSQAFGIMADLDLGTEHLRWMGDNRFTVGYVQGVLARRTYRVRVDMKVVDSDKQHMAAQFNEWLKRPDVEREEPLATLDGSMPELRFGDEHSPIPAEAEKHASFDEPMAPGWHTVEADVFFLYGGKLPFIAQDVNMFPVARPDGFLDLCVVGPVSRLAGLTAMDGADKGGLFANKRSHYFKCSMLRVTPLAKHGFVAIDGEKVPHTPFQVEPHGHLARILSLTGKWYGSPVQL